MIATNQALSRLGRSAVRYAEQGWHVFPLLPRGKHPLIKGGGGFLGASADVTQVRRWWLDNPTANIGLWPGQSGFVILDIDGPEGEAHAIELGALSEPTLVCTTGREDGGRHLYFRRPDFTVSNCDLAPKLDVRGDAGYVILPPSVHPSGRTYAWLGSATDIRDLPPSVLTALIAAQDRQARSTAAGATTPGQLAARDLVLNAAIDEGGRNNSLTRIAGRLLAHGIPEDEVLVALSGINHAKCIPPLPQHEVNVIVAGIARREMANRRPALRIVGPDESNTPEEEAPSLSEFAERQVSEAVDLLSRDLSRAPRWSWVDLDKLVGPMMPGDLVIVGALMGNGKTSVLLSQMDAFATSRVPTLYIPLEVDPAVCRLRWAAWRLGLDQRAVIRQDWAQLPEGSREAIATLIDELGSDSFVHFVPDKRLTLPQIVQWCRRAKDEAGCRVVMLDHFHRLEFGGDAIGHRVHATDVVRRLKDVARELGIVLIAAAQLNRAPNDPLDAFLAPHLSRLKETSALGEEADVVLMLSRLLKSTLPEKWHHLLRTGKLREPELAEPNTMVITCRKHRLDDSALNQRALLGVENGRLIDRLRPWFTTPDYPERKDLT